MSPVEWEAWVVPGSPVELEAWVVPVVPVELGGGVGGVGGVGGANRPSQLPAGGAGGNNWQHNPAHRGGAPYGDRATADRFGGAARGDSLANRQAGARNQIGRQGGNLPSNRGGAGASNRMNAGGGRRQWRGRRRSRPRRKPRCLPSLRRRPQRLRIGFPRRLQRFLRTIRQ